MPHEAILSWTASNAGDLAIVGYNIYRGSAAGAESTTPLNSSPISGTTFTDTTVQPGDTYFYIVKAVDSAGSLSSASNEVSGKIPLVSPTAPTGLTLVVS